VSEMVSTPVLGRVSHNSHGRQAIMWIRRASWCLALRLHRSCGHRPSS